MVKVVFDLDFSDFGPAVGEWVLWMGRRLAMSVGVAGGIIVTEITSVLVTATPIADHTAQTRPAD